MKNTFMLLTIAFLLTSCDTKFDSKGLVVDKLTKLPIHNVKINIKELDSTYTDSLGRFVINKFVNGWAGDFEILLEKEGYKTRHINFETRNIKRDSAVIELEKLASDSESYCFDKKIISHIYYFNKYFLSFLNVLTILFLIIKKIKWKIVWILGILLNNLTIWISYTDCSIIKFHFINGPIYWTHFGMNPYSFKIVIPIITLVFWTIYLIKKNVLIKETYRLTEQG